MNRDVDSFLGCFVVFAYWIVAGAGAHVGWALIGLLVNAVARAL